MSTENRVLAICCLIAGVSCTASGEMLCSGEGGMVSVDLTSGTRTAAATERIFRSAAWADGAASDAVTVVELNGVSFDVSEGSGFIDWTPMSNGVYTLSHKVMSGGVQLGETLTASFTVQGIVSDPGAPVVSLGYENPICSGESETAKIDLTTGTRLIESSERIGYSSLWGWAEGAASESTAIVEANGETVISTSGSGFIDWMPPSNGVYVLTHRVMSYGVQIGETLTATFDVMLASGIVVDVGDGKSVTVPQTWLDEHPAIVVAAGGDKAAALSATAANGRLTNAECYVLGIDPGKADEDFKIVSFPMKDDGTPDWENIVYEPAEAKWNVQGARAVVKGVEALGDEWKAVEGASAADKAKMRFFKVTVELP